MELAGVDPCHVEDLVYELEQVTAGAAYVPETLVLRGVQLVELEELRETEDRVQRRAQLVAHPREELTLRPVRLVELPLERRLLTHVCGDGHQRHDLQVVVEKDLVARFDDDTVSFRVTHPESSAIGHDLAAQEPAERSAYLFAVVGVYRLHVVDGATQDV